MLPRPESKPLYGYPTSVESILVGYRAGADGKRALERAIQLATAFEAELLIATVVATHEDAIAAISPVGVPVTDERFIERVLEEARAALAEAGQQAEEAGIRHELIALEGVPAQALVEVADVKDVDLIVVGTREPGFLERLVRRSVSEAVSRHAHKDVLVVHPQPAAGEA